MDFRNDIEHGRNQVPPELKWIDRITRLLDSKFKIPGTNVTFGLDPVIGLVPYFGEIVSFSISGILVLSMIRHGASGKVAAKMLVILAVDAASGMVPVFGDIFDVFFKANRRNYKMLLEHQAHGKHSGSAWPLVLGVTIVILIMLALMIWGMFAIVFWLVGLF